MKNYGLNHQVRPHASNHLGTKRIGERKGETAVVKPLPSKHTTNTYTNLVLAAYFVGMWAYCRRLGSGVGSVQDILLTVCGAKPTRQLLVLLRSTPDP